MVIFADEVKFIIPLRVFTANEKDVPAHVLQ